MAFITASLASMRLMPLALSLRAPLPLPLRHSPRLPCSYLYAFTCSSSHFSVSHAAAAMLCHAVLCTPLAFGKWSLFFSPNGLGRMCTARCCSLFDFVDLIPLPCFSRVRSFCSYLGFCAYAVPLHSLTMTVLRVS